MTERTYVFQGIAELITQLLGQGLAWGVVTNKSMRFTHPLTQRMSLFATASAVIAGDSTPHAKPHPAPLLEAARQFGWPRPIASTWGMTSAMWWRAWPPAWVRWLPPTAISAVTPTPSCGGPMPHIQSPLDLLPLLKSLAAGVKYKAWGCTGFDVGSDAWQGMSS